MDREAARAAIDALLRAVGQDPDRDPLFALTSARVADAFVDDLCSGYGVNVDELLASSVMTGGTELVVVRDLAVTTLCPHHLMPAAGFATVAFAPDERIVGVGTIGAVVDAFARRLTLQETLGNNVVQAFERHVAPVWVGCRLVLTHHCMTSRGERKHGARVETVALAGGSVDEPFAYQVLGVGR